jgi:hypothetical protein
VTADVVDDVAIRVAKALERCGVEYVIGGSVASSLMGESRATQDIDFAVALSQEHVLPLIEALGEDFSVDEEGLREAVRLGRSTNVFFLPLVTKIDFFVRGAHPFDRSELSRKLRVRPGRTDEEVFVASPEDTILRKLVWFRAGGETSETQWRDVLGVLRVSGPRLERAYLAVWATPLGVQDLLDRALAQG